MSTPSRPVELGRWFPEAAGSPDLQGWRALAEKALRGKPLDRLTREVAPGVTLPPLVAPGDAQGKPLGRRGPWQIRQEVRGPGLKAAARAAASEVSGGTEAVWLRVDRSTRLGVRPDQAREHDPDPGLTLLTRDDLAGVLGRVDLSRTPVVIEAGANALALMGGLLAVAAGQGVAPSQLQAVIQGDPLGTLARDGQLPRGVDAAYDDLAACVRFARDHAPGLKVVSLSGLAVHEAGADAATELGAVLAALTETARRLQARGLELADWLPYAEVSVGIGGDLLLDVARLRALRRLWVRLGLAAGLANVPLFVHARMADATLTHRDPWTNLLRATQAGFVGAVAGADALTLLPFDRGQGESTAQARRIARNLHLLLREEAHLDRVSDPAAGSGTFEHLTDGLCRSAWQALQGIEAEGGLLASLGAGALAAGLASRTGALRARIRRRSDAIVGVSQFSNADETPLDRPVRDPVAVDRQLQARWQAASIAQDSQQLDPEVVHALQALRSGGADRVEPARVAAAHGLLLAEIAGSVPGMAFTAPRLDPFRPSAEWESVANAVQALQAEHSVFLANLGPLAVHTARAGFARDLFTAGGFEVRDVGGFDDPDGAATAFGTSGCSVACICGTDNDYERVVPTLAKQLAAAGARAVLVAGRWPDDPGPWRQAGVTDVVHVGADVLAALAGVARALGASDLDVEVHP